MMLFYFLGVLLLTIFGSNIPPNPIKSSGQELVIKFKSHLSNGPFYSKNIDAKFLLTYDTEYNSCNEIYNVESGEISTPRYSSLNSGRVYCSYKITAPKGRMITVEMIKGKSIAQTCDGYLLIENASKEKFVVFQGVNTFGISTCVDPVTNPSSTNYIYESTSNEMELHYIYISGSQTGFQLKFSSNKPSICGGVIDASINGKIELPIGNITNFHCGWDLTNTNGSIVIETDFKINQTKTRCPYDSILLATNEDESILLKRYCPKSYKNDKFIIISPLPMTKLLLSADKKTLNFTASLNYYINMCGGVLRGQIITITSPNYPNNYKENTNCAWSVLLPEGENVNIRFNDIDLDSSCDNNHVIIHDGPSPESPVLGKYCGNILPQNLVATSNELWIVFSSETGKNNSKGFNITLESTQSGCGNIYISEKGRISTKNYPNLYPNNEECEWTIGVLPNNKVSFQFVERFNLEQSVNCTKDYVQVFDFVNDNWEPLGNRLCGRQIPPTFKSSETKLKVRIRTDGDIQGDGFRAEWKSVCGGIFTKKSGKIFSPNYPAEYPKNVKCNYTILSPGENIELTFKSFDLEGSKCRYDNLTIYDKIGTFDDQSKHIIGTYCGDHAPNTFTFLNSVMMIFMSDSSVAKKGFEINYEFQGCGSVITTPGSIKSPVSFDKLYGVFGYPRNSNCTWIIRAPPEQIVQLIFTKFRLESDYDDEAPEEERCPDDYVNVFDESDLKANNYRGLGKFCGILDESLPEIKSKTNTMYVNFVTDSSINDEGFVGDISFTYGEAKGCGGTIRLNQSNIIPGYTLKVPKISAKTYLNCGWLILLEQSYVAQMQVVNYTETPKCSLNKTDCRCSSLQFFDGPGRKALKIRQYCSGNVDYAPLLSSGSEAFIAYSYVDTDVDVHFEIKITPVTSVCGPTSLMVTNKTQVLTSPNYQLVYGNNLMCTWFLQSESPNTVISLRFTELDLENTTDCSSNYLEVYYTQWVETSYSNIIRMCHANHTFDFVDKITNGVKLKLHTDDRKTSKGFKLEYKSTSCPNTYDKPDGRILFSDQDKASEEECVFTINVGQSNLTISLYISSFHSWGPTLSNYLKVYDGPNVSSPLVATFNDVNVIPAPVFSNGSTLTMAYKRIAFSDGLLDMSYTSTDQGRGCGGKMFNVKGTVTSPMYPNLYRVSSTCRWDIAVPRPNPVEISFKVFKLGTRTTCDTDYLEIHNVDQITGVTSFVAKYCGGDTPAAHTSKTGAVFIRYVTTVHNSGTGWVLQFELNHNIL